MVGLAVAANLRRLVAFAAARSIRIRMTGSTLAVTASAIIATGSSSSFFISTAAGAVDTVLVGFACLLLLVALLLLLVFVVVACFADKIPIYVFSAVCLLLLYC